MIYTAAIGGRDKPRDDIRCFTSNRWFSNQRMAAKVFKILPHLYFEGTSIWLDANIYPLKSEAELCAELLGEADIGIFKHPYRKNPAQEVKECANLKLDDNCTLKNFSQHYGDSLKELELFECNVILRRDTPSVRRFNEIWWALICRWSQRDQITFPIALKQSGLSAKVSKGNVREHPFFDYRQHHRQAPHS